MAPLKKVSSYVKVVKRRRKYKHYSRKKYPNRLLPKTNLKPELKYDEETISNQAIDYAGYTLLMNGMNQGTTSQTRIGNVIKMKSYNAILNFSASVPQTVKIAIIYDAQSNGEALALSNYLNPIVYSSVNKYPPWCQRRLDIKDRYTTLKEHIFNIAPQISNTAVNKEVNLFGYIKRGVEVLFNGNGDTYSAINKGSLWLYITTSNTDSTKLVVNGTIRIKYTDD